MRTPTMSSACIVAMVALTVAGCHSRPHPTTDDGATAPSVVVPPPPPIPVTRVIGTVTVDGQPAANAQVIIYGSIYNWPVQGASGHTDSGGHYSLENLPTGFEYGYAYLPGQDVYQPCAATVSLGTNGEGTADFALTTHPETYTFPAGASKVTGMVFISTPAGRQLVPDAGVSAETDLNDLTRLALTRPDATGHYALCNLPSLTDVFAASNTLAGFWGEGTYVGSGDRVIDLEMKKIPPSAAVTDRVTRILGRSVMHYAALPAVVLLVVTGFRARRNDSAHRSGPAVLRERSSGCRSGSGTLWRNAPIWLQWLP